MDRFGASHFLQPVLDGQESAFFTNGDDPQLQMAWARENGLKPTEALENILLAQIEAHRTEVFYNLDPVRQPTAFVKRLPGCVRRTIAWRAAPLNGADLSGYDLVVSNFPEIMARWRGLGLRTGIFYPAHDPVLDEFAMREDRPVDVLFVGSYGRNHLRRARILEEVASLKSMNVQFRLDSSRLTRLAETPLGVLPPLSKYSRPAAIRRVSKAAVFGRDLYAVLASARIVINCAIDMAGAGRGNMRCFEAMGAGSLLVSDAGDYPPGMVENETLLTYASPEEVGLRIRQALEADGATREIAARGRGMISSRYSKAEQMRRFTELVG